MVYNARMTEAKQLTRKQQAFIDAYLVCFNGAEAARRAGYSAKTARQTASDLLAESYISEIIDREMLDKNRYVGNINKRTRVVSECVYLIQAANGLVKIGIAGDVHKRLNSLNTASPVELSIIFYFKPKDAAITENYLHGVFMDRRVKGEWFNLSNEDIDWIKENCDSF